MLPRPRQTSSNGETVTNLVEDLKRIIRALEGGMTSVEEVLRGQLGLNHFFVTITRRR